MDEKERHQLINELPAFYEAVEPWEFECSAVMPHGARAGKLITPDGNVGISNLNARAYVTLCVFPKLVKALDDECDRLYAILRENGIEP